MWFRSVFFEPAYEAIPKGATPCGCDTRCVVEGCAAPLGCVTVALTLAVAAAVAAAFAAVAAASSHRHKSH